jgi:proline dehydrogenase
MSVMRTVLLAGSESRWLRRQAPRMGFIKKAVKRFMPGEKVEDALTAATTLQPHGISTVLTKLGENITELTEADEVTAHYLDVLDRVSKSGLDCQISVKPTQLGLDVDLARCTANLRTLASRAQALGNFVWIDMEQHRYVDATLEVYRKVLSEYPNLGVCLQAYLFRTAKDLESIIPLGGGVRLVKGAYKEPESVAFPLTSDVDKAYLELAKMMIGPAARKSGFRAIYGTHDQTIINAIKDHAQKTSVPKDGFEYDLLYGINRDEQAKLAQDRYRIRVLISYGEFWFPWYMRRLAERPANVWFVAKSMFSS